MLRIRITILTPVMVDPQMDLPSESELHSDSNIVRGTGPMLSGWSSMRTTSQASAFKSDGYARGQLLIFRNRTSLLLGALNLSDGGLVFLRKVQSFAPLQEWRFLLLGCLWRAIR